MSESIQAFALAMILVGLMAVADSPVDLVSEREIPTTEEIWEACCSHRDCKIATIMTHEIEQGRVIVKVDAYPAFSIKREKVFHSTNGQSYFCRVDVDLPPTTENIRCIFVSSRMAQTRTISPRPSMRKESEEWT